jgi:hypothetical protein
MAASREEDMVDGDGGYISDESDFYGTTHCGGRGPVAEPSTGGEDEQEALERRARSFDPVAESASRVDLTAVALSKIRAREARPDPNPEEAYNPWEGEPRCARQLGESVDAFLERLPPRTTPIREVGPFIYIANPYSDRRATDPDLAGYKEAARGILDGLSAHIASVRSSHRDATENVIFRRTGARRAAARDELLEAARAHGVTSGTWMLFPIGEDVDRVWRVVAEGTVEGSLGYAAKVAADEGNSDRGGRLIGVYTEDFSDREDVGRVLRALVDKGLVSRKGSSGIYYKPGK